MIRTTTALSAIALLLAACETTSPAPADRSAPAAENEVASPAVLTAKLPAIDPVIPMPSAPLEQSETLTRIGIGSCLKQQDDQAIWNTVAAANPDLFLFIGDNVYGDIYSGDPNMGELRSAYRTLAQSKPFEALRATTPVMAVWDDHDYGLNDAGGEFALKYGTEALFEEAWALPGDDPRRGRDGIYHSEIVGPPGKRVQIILLDTRFFRSGLLATDERGAPGKERYLPNPDQGQTMLGEAQYAWLAEELSKPADVRLIVSSIQVIAEGHGWEAWATLPTDRQRFYDTLSASGAENIVLISGDRHSGALYQTLDAVPYPLYELTTSSLNAPSSIWREESGETYMEPGPRRLGDMYYEPNFGTIDIDWAQETITLSLVGDTGAPVQSRTIPLNELRMVD